MRTAMAHTHTILPARFVWALLLLLGAAPVHAMSVNPTVIDMASGSSGRKQITVVNDGAKPLPIEIMVSRIELNENGDTAAKPAGDEFLIFPPQALVPA